MEQSISINKIRREIFNIRKELADINGEYSLEEKKFDIYLWKGIRIEGHKTKPIANILLAAPGNYIPVPDSKYMLLLIRDDLIREKQILTRELINKITKFRDDKARSDSI